MDEQVDDPGATGVMTVWMHITGQRGVDKNYTEPHDLDMWRLWANENYDPWLGGVTKDPESVKDKINDGNCYKYFAEKWR